MVNSIETMQTFFAHTLVAKQSMDSPCVQTVFGGVILLPLPPEVKQVALHLYLFALRYLSIFPYHKTFLFCWSQK